MFSVGDRVRNQSWWTGTVVEVSDNGVRVEFDNGQPSDLFGLEEDAVDGGVLKHL
ncbi:Uncharacterised protein [Mycolicibacterium phlei]|nr:Uncharacterised protein [Mycolicibacterium phlei]